MQLADCIVRPAAEASDRSSSLKEAADKLSPEEELLRQAACKVDTAMDLA